MGHISTKFGVRAQLSLLYKCASGLLRSAISDYVVLKFFFYQLQQLLAFITICTKLTPHVDTDLKYFPAQLDKRQGSENRYYSPNAIKRFVKPQRLIIMKLGPFIKNMSQTISAKTFSN